MTEYDERWITTYSGNKLHYEEPSPDEINIEDIAHALSLKCRFSGHCFKFYSVAEHSVRVAELLPDELKLSGLLHDAAEAYIPDIPRPIKVSYGLKAVEDVIKEVINAKFGLVESPLIREADNILIATEARDLMPNTTDWAKLPEPLEEKIIPLSQDSAKIAFMHHYHMYAGV